MKSAFAAISFMLTVATLPAGAEQMPGGHGHMPGMTHGVQGTGGLPATRVPTQPGQAAFAAIQEIVEILEADPRTDWAKVDIAALRQHLLDMSNVTLEARADGTVIDGGMRFVVTGSGDVASSIQRMVTAHAATMDGVGGWRMAAATRPDGAVLSVTATDHHDAARIRALGFFGVMARGMHHQQHHLAIASGASPHQ